MAYSHQEALLRPGVQKLLPKSPEQLALEQQQANVIPERFQDYQPQHFSIDGFNALSPFEQAQIQNTINGFQGRYKNPLYTDPYDDEDNGVGNWTSDKKYETRAPQSKDEWRAYLAEFAPERSKFYGGETYGVQDEMRYLHSLFDQENMVIPDDPAAAEAAVAVEDTELAGDEAPDVTEEEAKEEEDTVQILTNAPTSVNKENVRVKLNQPTAKNGGTQKYSSKNNLAKIVTPTNNPLSI
tara:strand:- start:21 stop:740 length:720 start_codon:yes stop_codon:yes gene_type:complete